MNFTFKHFSFFAFPLLLMLSVVNYSPGQTLVWDESFTTTSAPAGWVTLDNGAGSWGFTATAPHQAGTHHARHSWGANASSYLITKAVNMTAGNIYDLKYWYRAESASFAETYAVKVGTAQTAVGQSTTLFSETTGNTTYTQKTVSYTAPTTGTYYFSWHVTSDDMYYLHLDEVEVFETVTCIVPAATATVVPDCTNGEFSVSLNVSTIGDATAVDITSTPASNDADSETGVTAGTYTFGPYPAGTNVTFDVNGSGYSGCDFTTSPAVTENCACTTTPTATVGTANLNCGANTYDIQVTVTSFGDGTSADIYIDGASVQTGAVLSNTYTFAGYATGAHTIDIKATGGAFITCETPYATNETCNGGDTCADAVDITGSCPSSFAGDLSVANIDGGALIQNYIGCGNGDNIANCGANPTFYGSAYVRTDHTDLWYSVNPGGANTFTVTISNLVGGNVMVLPYLTNGTCPSTSGANTTLATHISIGAGSITGGNCPYFSADGSITFTGADIATATTVYLRVMPWAPNGSGATNCETLTYPTFNICTTVPQPNDICANAVNITLNNGGMASTGNLGAATNEGSDEWECGGATSTAGDLWYEVFYPDFPTSVQSFFTELTLSGNAGDQVRVIVYDQTAACGSATSYSAVDYCEDITLTGGSVTTTLGDLLSTDGFDRFIQLLPISVTGNVTASANVIFDNSYCAEHGGYDITSALDLDFNYATASTATPTNAGPDLWYEFDPNTGNDGFTFVASTSADITVTGLAAGEQLTAYLYYGNIVSTDNCMDYTTDYITEVNITGDGTYTLPCLDEIHNGALGGYLIRFAQVAGGTTANPTITVTPSVPGPFNNDCENIWGGTSPANLGSDYPAAEYYNGWYLMDGEIHTDNFTGATDCNPAITSAVCSGVDYAAISAEDERDLWFVFEVPDNECATKGLTESTTIESAVLGFDSGSGSKNAIFYVYSDCGDANLVDCSGIMQGDGAVNNPWTVSGLTQGEFYMIRAKPSYLNSDFDFQFDISMTQGNPVPCNNNEDGAWQLNVADCPDYDMLETWSAQGATDVHQFGQNDVWFKFTAPDPANGNDTYFVQDKSWVTVFLEGVSGHNIQMELYKLGTPVNALNTYSVSGAGDRVWGKFGHLEPGQEYQIRLYHNQISTVNVTYKLEVYAEGDVDPWGCGEFVNDATAKLCGSCGGTPEDPTESLCEEWYKIDLPPLTPGNLFWMIEVRGYDQVLDFELRSAFITESSATEGDLDDFDHPCSSRVVEPAVNLIASATTAIDYEVTAGSTYSGFIGGATGTGSCQDSSTDPPYGGGFRRVYQSLNGPDFGQKDFYYLRVFMDPDDANYTACATDGTEDIFACDIIFKGPYLTQAAAEGGGAPNVNLCTRFDYCDLSSDVYPAVFSFYTDEDEDNRSDNGVWLGNIIDSENDSWGTGGAVSDDTNGDDEDGLIIDTKALAPGGTVKFKAIGNAIATGTNVHIGMWIDWDNNGQLENVNANGDQEFYSGMGTTASPVDIFIDATVPTTYTPASGDIFVRVKAGTAAFSAGDAYNDLLNGEVEGHKFGAIDILLPVELSKFEGFENGRFNTLNWESLTEDNSEWYIIERSANGIDGFREIGRVKANGNSASVLKYTFNDESPLVLGYYRLKMVDFDESFEYSKVITIERETKGFSFVSIAPVPTRDLLMVSFRAKDTDEITFTITNPEGKVIHTAYAEVDEVGEIRFDLSDYVNGVYYLTMSDGQLIRTERFVVMK